MKICFLLPSLSGGGAEEMSLRLARALVGQGHEVSLVHWKPTADLGERLGTTGPRVRLLSAKSFPQVVLAFARYLRRERPDIVIAGLTPANLAALFSVRLSGIRPFVAVVEHNSLRLYGEKKPWPVRLMRFVYPAADAVVAVSRTIATELYELIGPPARNLRVVNNPVLDNEFEQRAQAPIDHPWFADSTLKIIVAAGRLEPVKCFDLLIHAFNLLGADPALRLLILGEGSESASLSSLIHDLGLEDRVQLAGYRKNPLPFIRRSQTFVLSSRSEGLPTVLIEALLLGVPVVATDCAGRTIPDLFQGAGYGILAKVGDVADLAERIKASLAESRHDVSESFRAAFDVERVTQDYLALAGWRDETREAFKRRHA